MPEPDNASATEPLLPNEAPPDETPPPVENPEDPKVLDEKDPKRIENRAKREAAQTQCLTVKVLMGREIYGVGLEDASGHCLVGRIVDIAYEGETSLQIQDRIVNVQGEDTTTFAEVLEAFKKRPPVLELTVMRDPTILPPKGWLQDRIYDGLGEKLFYRIVKAFWTLVACAVLFGLYKLSQADIDWAEHMAFAVEAQNPMTRHLARDRMRQRQEAKAAALALEGGGHTEL